MTRAAALIAELAQDHVQNERRLIALKGIRSYAKEIGAYVQSETDKGHLHDPEMKTVWDSLAVILWSVEELLK